MSNTENLDNPLHPFQSSNHHHDQVKHDVSLLDHLHAQQIVKDFARTVPDDCHPTFLVPVSFLQLASIGYSDYKQQNLIKEIYDKNCVDTSQFKDNRFEIFGFRGDEKSIKAMYILQAFTDAKIFVHRSDTKDYQVIDPAFEEMMDLTKYRMSFPGPQRYRIRIRRIS